MPSFLNNLDFNNLFNDDTFKKAMWGNSTKSPTGPYSIRITPTGGRAFTEKTDTSVFGMLKNNVNFSINANWETLGFESALGGIFKNNSVLNALSTGVNALNKVGGTSLTNAGLVTEKFYQGGGGYLTISPEFRVLDWENTGEVWANFLALITMVLPRLHRNVQIKDIYNWIKTQNPDSLAAKGLQIGEDVLNKMSNGSFGPILEDIGSVATYDLKQLGEGDLSLTEGPSPVKVEIGQWFVHDNMVIDSVSFDMSDKMTDQGPMFMDVSITLSSREAMILDSYGVKDLKVGPLSTGNTQDFNINTNSNFPSLA